MSSDFNIFINTIQCFCYHFLFTNWEQQRRQTKALSHPSSNYTWYCFNSNSDHCLLLRIQFTNQFSVSPVHSQMFQDIHHFYSVYAIKCFLVANKTNKLLLHDLKPSHIIRITPIASLVSHPFMNPNCVSLIKYLTLPSSPLVGIHSITFDAYDISLKIRWSLHAVAFIFFCQRF